MRIRRIMLMVRYKKKRLDFLTGFADQIQPMR
jgi:hypothetical protein